MSNFRIRRLINNVVDKEQIQTKTVATVIVIQLIYGEYTKLMVEKVLTYSPKNQIPAGIRLTNPQRW